MNIIYFFEKKLKILDRIIDTEVKNYNQEGETTKNRNRPNLLFLSINNTFLT